MTKRTVTASVVDSHYLFNETYVRITLDEAGYF